MKSLRHIVGADAQDGFSLGSDASLGGFVWGDYEIRRSTRVRVPVQYIYDPLEVCRFHGARLVVVAHAENC